MYVITIQYIDNLDWSVEYAIHISENMSDAKHSLHCITKRLTAEWKEVSDVEYYCESNGYRIFLGINKVSTLDAELENLKWLFDD